jgi:uncharacterized membrane protein YgcG
MKTNFFYRSLTAIAAATMISTMTVAAQDSTATTQAATVRLSPAVLQVVQLAQAKVSDGTIVAYIQNSGTIYGLDANQIVYLRQQGVSDAVITTMLNQRTRMTASAAPSASQASTTSQNYSSDTSGQTSTAVAQPTTTYVTTAPASQAYVVPDTQTYYYDTYYAQPYYDPYYVWPYPALSFSFGFGRGFHGGGFHGGGFHGGGFHGGGGHHH